MRKLTQGMDDSTDVKGVVDREVQPELYVYYTVEPGQCEALKVAVRAFQQQLCETHPGLSARLLERVDKQATPDQPATWMEIYACPGGVPARWQDLIVQATLIPSKFIRGTRHVEVFAPCA